MFFLVFYVRKLISLGFGLFVTKIFLRNYDVHFSLVPFKVHFEDQTIHLEQKLD